MTEDAHSFVGIQNPNHWNSRARIPCDGLPFPRTPTRHAYKNFFRLCTLALDGIIYMESCDALVLDHLVTESSSASTVRFLHGLLRCIPTIHPGLVRQARRRSLSLVRALCFSVSARTPCFIPCPRQCSIVSTESCANGCMGRSRHKCSIDRKTQIRNGVYVSSS